MSEKQEQYGGPETNQSPSVGGTTDGFLRQHEQAAMIAAGKLMLAVRNMTGEFDLRIASKYLRKAVNRLERDWKLP